jgi:hypothetical protein
MRGYELAARMREVACVDGGRRELGAMPPSATEYREFMEECLRWARTTRSEKHREALIEMAKTWSEAAVQLERRHGLIVESRELLDVSEK